MWRGNVERGRKNFKASIGRRCGPPGVVRLISVSDGTKMQPNQSDELLRFHREYRPALMAFFLRRVHNYAEAEDMTQEVFSRIAGAQNADLRQTDGYIFQIAANLLRDRWRREKVRGDYAAGMRVVEDSRIETLDPHRVAGDRQALALLREGLAELPDRTRQIFLLFRYERIDQRTIAESFGISVSAVEKHIHRAMAKLIAKTGVRE